MVDESLQTRRYGGNRIEGNDRCRYGEDGGIYAVEEKGVEPFEYDVHGVGGVSIPRAKVERGIFGSTMAKIQDVVEKMNRVQVPVEERSKV